MTTDNAAPGRSQRQDRNGPSLSVLAFAALIGAVALARRPAQVATGSGPAGSRPPGSSGPRDTGADTHEPDEAKAATQEGDRGRHATTPGEIPATGWKDILWRTYGEFNDDRLLSVAAGVTFYALLALVPAIAAFISLYGLFFDAQTVAEHVQSLQGLMPGGAVEIVGDQVQRIAQGNDGSLGFAFAFGLLVSLWSANSGVKAVFDALNVVYEEDEKRSFLRLNLQSLLFTLGAIVIVLALLGAIAVLPPLLEALPLGRTVETLISVLRWPIALVVIALGLAVLYRYGPSREKAKWRWVTWGSGVASVGWLIFSMLFSWYVSNFGNYNATYGSLGAIVGFMTWIWLSTTIILLGAELNAEMEHQTAKDSTTAPHQPLGARGAAMADRVGAKQA